MPSVPISLHHFEVCVSDFSFVDLLVNGYGFKICLQRKTSQCHQYVVRSSYCVFIVTNRLSGADVTNKENGINTAENRTYPALYCCTDSQQHNDSVFNVALEVPNIQNTIQLIRSKGGEVIRDPEVIEDQYGCIKFAIISPPCNNIVHTLIEKTNYSAFLPGFEHVDIPNGNSSLVATTNSTMVDYIDHVTVVTEPGGSTKIIKWYEDIFKMRRLYTNRQDTPADGFVLGDSIGLRLKALQYWRCAETGVCAPGEDSPDQLKIVVAEPLPEVETSHVQAFLKANGGPGVQHIGFYTDSILETVAKISNNGVKFRMPPYTYYDEIIEKKELKDSGMENCLEKLKQLGILIDFEEGQQSVNYLMQIFSYPVFKRDTFFLEVIQRHGAHGFGSGNIAALARSIIRYQEEMKLSIPIRQEL